MVAPGRIRRKKTPCFIFLCMSEVILFAIAFTLLTSFDDFHHIYTSHIILLGNRQYPNLQRQGATLVADLRPKRAYPP